MPVIQERKTFNRVDDTTEETLTPAGAIALTVLFVTFLIMMFVLVGELRFPLPQGIERPILTPMPVLHGS